MSKKIPLAAVLVFVAVSFGLAWLIALPLWLMDRSLPSYSLIYTFTASAMMFTPAIAMLVVVFFMKTPRTERARFLGLWPLRPAKRVVWFMVASIFAPTLLVLLSLLIAALLGWVPLDLVNFSGFEELLNMQLAALDEGTAELARSTMPPIGLLVALQFLVIPFGALFNSILAFGEEIGWRGWLQPALRPLGVWPSLLATGAIWGLWHSPLILLGHNFQRYDWTGVALMVGGCVAWGMFFGWLRLRSGSVWPAVIAHGSLNASAGIAVVLVAAGVVVDPVLINPLGPSGWIALALAVLVLALLGQFKKEPELARKTAVVVENQPAG